MLSLFCRSIFVLVLINATNHKDDSDFVISSNYDDEVSRDFNHCKANLKKFEGLTNESHTKLMKLQNDYDKLKKELADSKSAMEHLINKKVQIPPSVLLSSNEATEKMSLLIKIYKAILMRLYERLDDILKLSDMKQIIINKKNIYFYNTDLIVLGYLKLFVNVLKNNFIKLSKPIIRLYTDRSDKVKTYVDLRLINFWSSLGSIDSDLKNIIPSNFSDRLTSFCLVIIVFSIIYDYLSCILSYLMSDLLRCSNTKANKSKSNSKKSKRNKNCCDVFNKNACDLNVDLETKKMQDRGVQSRNSIKTNISDKPIKANKI